VKRVCINLKGLQRLCFQPLAILFNVVLKECIASKGLQLFYDAIRRFHRPAMHAND